MQDFWLSFQQLMDPEYLLSHGGFYIVVLIVFAETGLFFGFFLPGDYLLFLAGLFCALGKIDVDITTMYLGILGAGILGNFTGYWFGYRTGPVLFKRKDSLLFKRKYVIMAEEFYQKYGGTALIIGRFVPIIRTFAPIFAGVVKLNFRKFVIYNVIGAFLWASLLTLTGYFLGVKFPTIIDYVEYIIVGLIVIAFLPIVFALLKRWLKTKKENKTNSNNN
ncbi:membrane-associated protein [Sphingobacterium allocomposti]|uniref:Membrane-associated protein n=1 Tax=Sphingobacterium allocomposti TaxID=415956 RepID=A0A5S5DKB7_9SPHI|nr:VTT domain-containing protein [Sphingobacterium composti Yoo et al. 2007 non Ten et al. 2007]TYP96105.1 membrane-associated protein [Sphingobacterium composti Yoo et al. 2007 non Ten et al. 2007]HLS96202.1 VTT domain-containing protein [Sphingobacterium sp.]